MSIYFKPAERNDYNKAEVFKLFHPMTSLRLQNILTAPELVMTKIMYVNYYNVLFIRISRCIKPFTNK